MIRPAIAVVLTLLTPGFAAAAESGGIALSQEAMASEAQIVGQAAATMQQLRGLATSVTRATVADPTLGQDDAAARSSVMAQESATRQSQLATKLWGHQPTVQFVDNSLTVNAANSPVTIGDGNAVLQTVSTSTAITKSGNANAQAAIAAPASAANAAAAQSASSQATSLGGGTAQAVSSNSVVAPL